MNREEAQPAWEKIVCVGYSNYQNLTRNQRVWFNIEPLVMQGLWDHYVNYGADRNSDTIADLEYLNFHPIANQLRKFNQTYFPQGVPQGPDARQDRMNTFSEEQVIIDIEEMENQFWKVCDDLENALLAHINNTGIAIHPNAL
jgi:hypothetical protein